MRLGLSRSRKAGGLTFAVIIVFLAAAGFIVMLTALKPAFIEYAGVYANNMANSVVNNAVNKVFSDNNYNSFAEFKDSGSENVRAIETDAVKINRIKAEIIQSMQERIKSGEYETVYIPLGSATDFYFFAGLGPKIPVKIYPVGIVGADFHEELNSAGINQVNHKIYLDVSINMSFVGFSFSKTETVKTSALLTDTIIVGDTPQYYGGSLAADIE